MRCGANMKVAFLDRDGTINLDYPDKDWKYVDKPTILDGTISAMQYLNEQGFEIIIVTNQYLIGEGLITAEQFHSFHNQLLELLHTQNIKVLDTFFCPHARTERCQCCKPKTGLIAQAIEKYPNIDLSKSIMCGDAIHDMKCAEEMGIKFYGIGFGMNKIKNLEELRNLI